MGGFLKLLFGGKKEAPRPSCEGEPLEAVYEEFCATFCHKPGRSFMAYAREHADEEFLKWLHWDNEEPEPKALFRLLVDMTRNGEYVWNLKEGFEMYHEGSWGRGGGPSEDTQHGLAILAEEWGVEFTVYYTETEDGPFMYHRFSPPAQAGGAAAQPLRTKPRSGSSVLTMVRSVSGLVIGVWNEAAQISRSAVGSRGRNRAKRCRSGVGQAGLQGATRPALRSTHGQEAARVHDLPFRREID